MGSWLEAQEEEEEPAEVKAEESGEEEPGVGGVGEEGERERIGEASLDLGPWSERESNVSIAISDMHNSDDADDEEAAEDEEDMDSNVGDKGGENRRHGKGQGNE